MVSICKVATVLTVYGIETFNMWSLAILAPCVATVLTVYGIETLQCLVFHPSMFSLYVATVLTVYGIETRLSVARPAVFKISLQQYLPFTVLKLFRLCKVVPKRKCVATVLTVYGIETLSDDLFH